MQVEDLTGLVPLTVLLQSGLSRNGLYSALYTGKLDGARKVGLHWYVPLESAREYVGAAGKAAK